MMVKMTPGQTSRIRTGHIVLVLMSLIDKHLLEVLERELKQTFNTEVEFRVKQWNLNYAYNRNRKQYSSAQLLRRLRGLERKPGDRIMGIVDVDIYSPGWEFIFGDAEINSGTAVLSLFLLKPVRNGKISNNDLFEKRVVKEAVHELGHLYYQAHCPDQKCVMYLSKSLADIDRKTKSICKACRIKPNLIF